MSDVELVTPEKPELSSRRFFRPWQNSVSSIRSLRFHAVAQSLIFQIGPVVS